MTKEHFEVFKEKVTTGYAATFSVTMEVDGVEHKSHIMIVAPTKTSLENYCLATMTELEEIDDSKVHHVTVKRSANHQRE